MDHSKEKLTITEWAEEDRPREKMLIKGISALSDAELLAILIGSGNKNESAVELSQRILYSVNNNLNSLGKLSINDLIQNFKGIGEAKAITIIAAMELGKRRSLSETEKYQQISSSRDIFHIFQPILGDLRHEEAWALLMNTSNKVLKKIPVSKGGITGTVIDIRLIIKEAIENLATNIVLVHNHPSGDTKPSEEDNAITKKLKEACKLIDIHLMDHVIICDDGYYSYLDNDKFL
ncbi:RadC family protein [Dysgonomonas alginatilytica]|nr:DNA repair protein RadC [Dysgonomonas alginatilytica]